MSTLKDQDFGPLDMLCTMAHEFYVSALQPCERTLTKRSPWDC
jgi:hypothetical protein